FMILFFSITLFPLYNETAPAFDTAFNVSFASCHAFFNKWSVCMGLVAAASTAVFTRFAAVPASTLAVQIASLVVPAAFAVGTTTAVKFLRSLKPMPLIAQKRPVDRWIYAASYSVPEWRLYEFGSRN